MRVQFMCLNAWNVTITKIHTDSSFLIQYALWCVYRYINSAILRGRSRNFYECYYELFQKIRINIHAPKMFLIANKITTSISSQLYITILKTSLLSGHHSSPYFQNTKPVTLYTGKFGYRRNTPSLRTYPSSFAPPVRNAYHPNNVWTKQREL